MPKPSILIGQCANGHDVHVTHDLSGDIDGGTIGVRVVQPLPDDVTTEPIVVACDECTKKVRAQTRSMDNTQSQELAIQRTKLLRELQRTRKTTGEVSPLSPEIDALDEKIAALVGWSAHKRLLEWAEHLN